MRYIEASHDRRLRASHLLLMIYRYRLGVYQVGDLSALNYVKGYLDTAGALEEARAILCVSGHGIGEAELWMLDRVPSCSVDSMSFRLLDTQLLHFLRGARPEDIERIFEHFAEMVEGTQVLADLVGDAGIVPYWCEQAEALARGFESARLHVYSDSPLRIPGGRTYDLVYVSQAGPYITQDAADRMLDLVSPGGIIAALMPAMAAPGGGRRRFADSPVVTEAKAAFRSLLAARGYEVDGVGQKPAVDYSAVAKRSEVIRFNILAPARDVIAGELILWSLHEHISDRDRLAALDEAASRFRDLQMPVNEELELHLMEGES